MTTTTTSRPRLHLSQDAFPDRLSALEFGRVDDGQPSERWVAVGEHVGLLHTEDGRCVGFLVLETDSYDPEAPEHEELWTAPRFDVPGLGLTDVAPNEIFLAARALFGSGTTLNRELFSHAIHAKGDVALRRWLRCLQAGDQMAHFALGYTLYELGRHPEAYRHLRHYSEIAPGEAWTWTWYGQAAAAIGQHGEARAAFERAIELDEDSESGAGDAAQEYLDELDADTFAAPPLVPAPDPELALLAKQDRLFGPLGYTSTTANRDGLESVLVDLDLPVWVHITEPDDRVTVRVQVGTIHPDDAEDEDLEDLFRSMSRLHLIEVSEENDVWIEIQLPPSAPSEEIDLGVLRALVLGAASSALELATLGETYDIDILPPPSFDEQYERWVDDEDA